MPKPMKSTLSFVRTLDLKPGRAARRPAKAPRKAEPVPSDADARRALAWLARKKPQAEIVHDDAVPKQSKADLAKFRRISYRRDKA